MSEYRTMDTTARYSPDTSCESDSPKLNKIEDLRKIMKLDFWQLKEEMTELDCERGNFNHLPLRFTSCRDVPKELRDLEYIYNNTSNISSKENFSKEKGQIHIDKITQNLKETFDPNPSAPKQIGIDQLLINENDMSAKEPSKYFKYYLRNYDIERIKHERVLHSFTIGRKIHRAENTDRKINQEIQSNIMGV